MSDDPLADAVRAYRRAQQVVERRRDELAAAITDASLDGRKQSEIARLTGYTREHIRRIVKDEVNRRIGATTEF